MSSFKIGMRVVATKGYRAGFRPPYEGVVVGVTKIGCPRVKRDGRKRAETYSNTHWTPAPTEHVPDYQI